MAIRNFKIMRGLPVPDNNFTWPLGDSWTRVGGSAADYVAVGPRAGQGEPTRRGADQWGTGRALVVKPDANYPATPGSSRYIESSYTPYGICNVPAPGMNITTWVGVTCHTNGLSGGNDNPLIGAYVQGYNASGSTTVGWDVPLTNAAGYYLGHNSVDQTDFALFSGFATGIVGTSTTWYKLQLRFAKPDSSLGTAVIVVDWCGIGIPFLEATGYDQIDSWYTYEINHGTGTELRWQSSKYRARPRVQVLNSGEHRAMIGTAFPLLDDDDKRLIQVCYMWNRGTPTDDISTGEYDSSYKVNRGQSLPVIVALDRDECKRAFYADFANELTFAPSTIGWWPESGARFQTSCTFEERL